MMSPKTIESVADGGASGSINRNGSRGMLDGKDLMTNVS